MGSLASSTSASSTTASTTKLRRLPVLRRCASLVVSPTRRIGYGEFVHPFSMQKPITIEWQAQQREKTKKLHQQRQVEDEEEERKVDEYCEIGMRLKDYPEDDLRQARQLFQPFSNLLKKWKSLIDVSEVRLKVSLETSPAQRPHGVLDSLFRMWNNSVNCCADGSSGRKHPSEKENGVNQVLDKGVGLSSLPISQESSTSKSRG
ncbi:hypothetical protein RHGRI_003325 [Rhododendron griersonianum]|uniref:Chlororespiratory reduction 7 n=1 Tax=Rhododendron griersonianum TaxID=479676 RepID=A0AAV6L788_9ERIC|nr:hypothetical protein RHGRI_003325 [Rhododendron griersonianum]